MAMDAKTLLDLAKAPAVARHAVQTMELDTRLSEEIAAIETVVGNLRALLFLKGVVATDFYHSKAKEMAFSGEETKVLPRVRWDARYGTPCFQWERLTRRTFPITESEARRFKKTRGTYVGLVKKNGRKVLMRVCLSGKVVPLQKATDAVARSTFDKEPAWAQFAGESAEAKLRQLRKQARQITAIAKHLSLLKTLAKVKED